VLPEIPPDETDKVWVPDAIPYIVNSPVPEVVVKGEVLEIDKDEERVKIVEEVQRLELWSLRVAVIVKSKYADIELVLETTEIVVKAKADIVKDELYPVVKSEPVALI
jgi:hypothetical protein